MQMSNQRSNDLHATHFKTVSEALGLHTSNQNRRISYLKICHFYHFSIILSNVYFLIFFQINLQVHEVQLVLLQTEHFSACVRFKGKLENPLDRELRAEEELKVLQNSFNSPHGYYKMGRIIKVLAILSWSVLEKTSGVNLKWDQFDEVFIQFFLGFSEEIII